MFSHVGSAGDMYFLEDSMLSGNGKPREATGGHGEATGSPKKRREAEKHWKRGMNNAARRFREATGIRRAAPTVQHQRRSRAHLLLCGRR